jgi:trans-aconitate methyltransferase
MKNIVERVYDDVIESPEAYPVEWIKSEGLPYWLEMLEKHPEAQKMVDLYSSMIR